MSLNKSKTLRAAEKYVLQGKIPAAIDEYRKVVDADPGDMTTINTLGDLYVRAGRIPDAIQNFSRIADSYRDSGFTLKAIAMLKKISKLDPTNIETSMKLANLYSQQGLFVEARQQYLQVADAYARAGQTRKALEAYQKIADLDPSNTSVRIKLGEIYSREGMIEQAHEAFIMAGAEFLRKGETELALAANLKALAIRPEGRQALTAIVSIYTQQGQADRAINILCDAFEKNPGDVELLTILGRTYLAAGYMDDAERTFLSLVELDKSRYNYLLEVGRKFLQTGDLDRAAEQIDGCLDVLISKREEDKGIDFLRRILERDVNHVGALKRLAQIFVRIREDHNLIATLNSLAEANLQKGDERAAVEVLEELVRLEPDEPRHRQRLYNLGVQDITEPGAPDVIRATGPLDYESAAFDDTFVIRQISEAEILAGHGQIDHAVSMLKEILSHAPENVQVHLKLKDIYLRAGMMEKAASQCMALSQVYESRGEPTKAMDCITEAQHLNPALQPGGQYAQWQDDGQEDSVGFEIPLDQTASQGGSSFEVSTSDRLDLSRYQTGALSDQMGFVTAPPKDPGRRGTPADANPPMAAPRPPSKPFTYSDTFTDGPAANVEGPAPSQDAFFTSAGSLPSDTMPSLLRDELEGIDFYIAQGYTDIAHDTLNRLRDEHGDHPEIMCRYERLGIAAPPTRAIEEDALARIGFEAAFGDGQDSVSSDDDFAVDSGPNGKFHHLDELPPIMESPEQFGRATGELVNAESNGHAASGIPDQELVFGLGDSHTPAGQQEESPFMVYQESGPLNDDLMVRFNTSELSMPSPEPDESAIQAEPMAPAEPSMYAETFDPMAAIPMGEPEIELPTDDSFFTNEPAPRGPVSDAGKSIPMRDPASRAKSNDVSAAPPTGDLAARIKISEGVFPTGDLARQKASDAGKSIPLTEPPARTPTIDMGAAIPMGEPAPRIQMADSETAIPSGEPTAETPPGPASSTPAQSAGTAELVASLLSGLDDSLFGLLDQPLVESGSGEDLGLESLDALRVEPSKPQPGGPSRATDLNGELREMFEDLSGNTGNLDPLGDYETHYSLGLAYKDMELLDEAIEQFQLAFRQATRATMENEYFQCCNMLGVCFEGKRMPKLAVMWFSRGIKVPDRTEDEYQALRFQIGLCYEEMGDIDKAIDAFSEVYGIDVNYRHVSEKLKELQALKNA